MDLTLTVVGNLTDNPDLRFTATGVAVCKVTIAHNPRVKDTATGQWKDGEPTFVAATAWRQLAENLAESLTKGARVVATGRLRTERWDDKTTGEKRSRLVMDLDGVGPDLACATVQVRKISRNAADPWAATPDLQRATPGAGPAAVDTPPPF